MAEPQALVGDHHPPAGGTPRYLTDEVIPAAAEFHTAAAQLAALKRRQPGDDCMTVWTGAEVDGAPSPRTTSCPRPPCSTAAPRPPAT